MNRFKMFSLALLFSTQAQAKLVVHEWGTFTSLVGSNGQAQSGMYYEDEALPDFVHNFGDQKKPRLTQWPALMPSLSPTISPVRLRDRNCPGPTKVPCEYLYGQNITQKMETPVVYFYADKPQSVRFNVWFPSGIISQSYPEPVRSLPEAIPGVDLKNGFAQYDVNILKDFSAQPPSVGASNIYSHARNVGSDLIQSGDEIEKFIFYRGLGEFKTKLQTHSQAGSLQLTNSSKDAIPQVFVIYTDGKTYGDFHGLGRLNPNETRTVNQQTIRKLKSSKQPQSVFLAKAQTQLLHALTDAGLYSDEAKAMVDTWRHGYFQTPGLRVLYILGNDEVDSILPIEIIPHPAALRRVFVGRIELLLDSDEEQVLNVVLREKRDFDVGRLGRMAQPILNRIREVAHAKGLLTDDLSQTIDHLISQIP